MKDEVTWDDLIISTFNTKTGGFAIPDEKGIRIFHKATGIEVECSTERSQHANRAKAFDLLKEKVALFLYENSKTGFSNKTIQEPTHGKPHICKRAGWWRVSPWKRRTGALYYLAHDFARKLNDKEQRQCSKHSQSTKHDDAR